jgi:hypothetical protein
MKTTQPSQRTRAVRESKIRTKRNYEQALRACEAAAARIKMAGDELASGWSALCQAIATGVSPTDLLRKRAWCNVLELRLKEQAYALEEARRDMDKVWEEMMLTTRARELFNQFVRKDSDSGFSAGESVPMLIRTATAMVAEHAGGVSLKK